MSKFNIEERISAEISKANTLLVCNYIISNPNSLDELYNLIFTGKGKTKWRAAWVFEHVFLAQPDMINPYIPELIKRFPDIKDDGVRRHFAKILSLSDINAMADGNLIDTCFSQLMSETIPVAVKTQCMQILFNITREYPDLKRELIMVLEEQMPNNSAGFKSRANKLIKALSK